MTDGAYAPPCGRLHSLQSWVPVKLVLVYLGHTCLVRLSAHTLTSPQSVKSGLRLVALIARTNGLLTRNKTNRGEPMTLPTKCITRPAKSDD